MNKESLNEKTARRFIIDGRNSGKTDQEIYHELSQKFYDKKTIALLIAGTVTAEKKGKYKMYNNVLLVLIGVFVLFKAVATFNSIEGTNDLWFFLVSTIVIFLLAGYIMYEIARYNGPIYRVCGLFTILILLQSIMNTESVFEFLINVLIFTAIACLSFYLDRKMFPNYRYKKLKKDSNGEYIFDTKESR
jgi:hypothetical protein